MNRVGPAQVGGGSSNLERALRRLPTHHRQILLECGVRGASVAEAAQTLGVSVSTVKYHTHYALQALRLAVDATDGVP